MKRIQHLHVVWAAFLGALALGGCASPRLAVVSPCDWVGSDACHVVRHARMDSSGHYVLDQYTVVPSWSSGLFSLVTPDSTRGREPFRPEDPLAGLNSLEADTVVMVTLTDDLYIPRFPEPFFDELPSSERNRRVLREADALVNGILQHRAASRDSVLSAIPASEYTIIEQFWLIDAFIIRSKQKHIRTIVANDQFEFLDAVYNPAPPLSQAAVTNLAGRIAQSLAKPADTLASAVEVARARIGSEAYFDQSDLHGGWVGLLDQGLNANHFTLSSPSVMNRLADCVLGGASCFELNAGFFTGEACGDTSHGTPSAAIITGNANLGEQYRGVTRVKLDSYRIYECLEMAPGYASPNLNYAASVRGFQAAVRSLDKVIVGELAGVTYECQPRCTMKNGRIVRADQLTRFHGIISHAANRAFDSGAVIVAAVGNTTAFPSQPGNAHRVLAVAPIDVLSQKMEPRGYGFGPMPDGRFKADIVAPTNTKTANGLTSIGTQIHTGSSGATPYVAGTAALLRNWLKRTSSPDSTGWRTRSVDAGQVYAQILLNGQSVFPFNDTTGAGVLSLAPPQTDSYWGKVVLDSMGVMVDIPLTNPQSDGTGGAKDLNAALWWPESFSQDHRQVSLQIRDASGAVRAQSNDLVSVFQKTRVAGIRPTDGWTLRIRGENDIDAPQVVYWAAHFR